MPNRLGFHYFPDTEHYSKRHLDLWLPVLEEMKVAWLVLRSPITHAIPEDFIRPISEAGIHLIVDFQHTLNDDPNWSELEMLLSVYGRWGVNYALLDRAANMRNSWGNTRWADLEIIQNYRKRWLKFAESALDKSVRPILGPLVPGGDYWDTAFLKILLNEIASNASDLIISNLTLAALGWDFGRSLDWGAGGPDAWRQTLPYSQPNQETQNQQGFRAFEWVDAAAQAVFGRSLPMMIFEVGIKDNNFSASKSPDLARQLAILGLTRGRNVYDPEDGSKLLRPIPAYIQSANFFVLSSVDPEHHFARWFTEDGMHLQPAQAFYVREGLIENDSPSVKSSQLQIQDFDYKYGRYILISSDLMSSASVIQDELQPLMEQEKTPVGFSIEDACQAAYIIFISPDNSIDPGLLAILKSNGGLVKVSSLDQLSSLLLEQEYENV